MSIGRVGFRSNAARAGLFERKMGFGIPGAVCFHHESGIGSKGGGGVQGDLPFPGRFSKMTLSDVGSLKGRIVMVRADFNVSDPGTGNIKSDARLIASVPTIRELCDSGARVVIISHNDDPHKSANSQNTTPELAMTRLTLAPVAERLGDILGSEVRFVNEVFGDKVSDAVTALGNGQVLLLENTRSDSRDVAGDITLAEDIVNSVRPEIVVIEGFSVMHRDQASVTGIANVMRERDGRVVAGRLVEKELDVFGRRILESPERPLVLFSGGSKVSGKEGKLKVLESLLRKVDFAVIGGAMLYAFLKASGEDSIGDDPLRGKTTEDDVTAAANLLDQYADKIILPNKVIVVKDGDVRDVTIGEDRIPKGYSIADLSGRAAIEISNSVGYARTAVWNGDFGYTNHPDPELARKFHQGSFFILEIMKDILDEGGTVAVGGGDTGKVVKAFMEEFEFDEIPVTHVSTAGGALLNLLAKGTLPGIEVIDNKQKL